MRRARHAFTGLALLFSAAGALSQGFPSKPVHIVVPFPPGGGADTLARIMEPKLAAIWQQAIVVENRPGASGHIGADFVAKSVPDGHTLLMSSTASLTEKNLTQFAPVSLVSASAYVVTANPGVAAADIRGLIALAKANPGKISFGSSGTGAASHLSAELFKSMAGVDLLHVPYKGTGQALTDLLAGHVNLMFAPAQTVMPYVRAGKLKALAARIGIAWLRSGGLVRPARAGGDAEGDGGEALSRSESRAGDERRARENAGPRCRARGQHARGIRALHTRRPGEVVQADERGGDYSGVRSGEPSVGGLRRWFWRRSDDAPAVCSDR